MHILFVKNYILSYVVLFTQNYRSKVHTYKMHKSIFHFIYFIYIIYKEYIYIL